MITKIEIEQLDHELRKLRLSGMANELRRQYEDPNIELKNPDERIKSLIGAEVELRHEKKVNKMLKKACLKYPYAAIDEKILYDPSRNLPVEDILKLLECDWISQGKNIVITGMTGTGKTHLACAFAMSAISQFYYSVFYIKADRLLKELKRANAEENLEYVDTICNYDLLIIDDFGLMDLDRAACNNLFQVIDKRNEERSTIYISQYAVAKWYELFENLYYADAIMERILNKSYRIDCEGESLRNLNSKK
jgi:DNA replication protein DnaC